MGTKMDRFRVFGEVSPRSAFYVRSWYYELEWWSKVLDRGSAESSPMCLNCFLEDRTENVDGLLPFFNACVGRVTKIRPRSIRFLERL